MSDTPTHIAIIMDGNGRWAKARGLPRPMGHRAGIEAVRRTITASVEQNVGYLTLYSFSSENWRRPADEVSFLMRLLQLYLKRELKELHENRVRLNAIGRLQDLPGAARAELKRSIALTAKNDGLTLTLALNYGGRQDIVDAAKKALALVKRKKLSPAKLDEALFGSMLSTGELPEVDLVIRTSGEMRLSNFLLWQTAYAEVYFTATLWPDFRQAQLAEALHDFARRERRFGDVAPRKS